ncbi:MAG TPA: DUF2520 domain-containing protein [Firmicutes bacterium]|nr:DUF2520 domain-containing protein [Bacillota bacterium]
MKRLAIIGAGNVGKVLGTALKAKGYRLGAAFCRTEMSRRVAEQVLRCPVPETAAQAAQAGDIVFITTPDRVIREVCEKIAATGGFRPGQYVLHTSGAHSSAVLTAARAEGAYVLSFHPLQTFPGLEVGLQSLPGTFFTVEGDAAALDLAAELVDALGGKMLSIPTALKPLYHAAACAACNYLVTLMDAALEMYAVMGIPAENAMEALSPLVQGTLRNIAVLGPQQALTGPIARGDLSTISCHQEILAQHCPALLPLYTRLGLDTVDLARRKGTLGENEAHAIKQLLGG